MFVRYVLVPELSESAKTQCVALHPNKPIMALSVCDTTSEIILLEYSFKEPSKASGSSSMIGNQGLEKSGTGLGLNQSGENGSNTMIEEMKTESGHQMKGKGSNNTVGF